MTAPPTPFHILRSHNAPVSTLSFDSSNSHLYAGDQDGFVSIIDLQTRRPISHWEAHKGGVLGVAEIDGTLISQGRDNKLHLYQSQQSLRLASGPGPSQPPPVIAQTLEINALNFCRFSSCALPCSAHAHAADDLAPFRHGPKSINGKGKGRDMEDHALLALPNLIDSEVADIYLLPSLTRLHAAINAPALQCSGNDLNGQSTEASLKPEESRTGLVMALHVGFDRETRLCLVLGYEDGRIEMWRIPENEEDPQNATDGSLTSPAWYNQTDSRLHSDEGKRWRKVYAGKGHNEAVMGMVVASDLSRAFTVSADHLLCRYDLVAASGDDGVGIKKMSTGQIGNASIAISADDKILAVGGWDGNIRLFSSASLKPLGVLSYHRETVQALAFANHPLIAPTDPGDEASTLELGVDDSDDDESDNEKAAEGRQRWLASGGKDRRIALWALKDFSAADPLAVLANVPAQ